jgi:2-dehydropantoate 2-reductase
VSFTDWEPEPGSTTLLCTKCYDNAEVLRRLPESAAVVPVQNGFDPALQARAAHVEGIASFVSECLPGRTHTRITRAGKLHLGVNRASGGDASRLHDQARRLAGVLQRAPFRVQLVADILPYKYTKLMYNSAIGPLAAAAGLDNGAVLRLPRVRGLFFALLRENHSILAGAGVPLGKVGPFHPATVARILRRPWLARALAWAFSPGLRGSYCSMCADLPAGRTEVDYYNGHLIGLAAGRPCPLNRSVYQLIKRLERQPTRPCPELLDGLGEAFPGEPVSSAIVHPLK